MKKTSLVTLLFVMTAFSVNATNYLLCWGGTLYIVNVHEGAVHGYASLGINCGNQNYASPLQLVSDDSGDGSDEYTESVLNRNFDATNILTPEPEVAESIMTAIGEPGSKVTVRDANLNESVKAFLND